MPGKIVRIRERNQVTLPPEMLSAASLRVGDFLEISVTGDGHLTLVPKRLVTWNTLEAEVADQEAETDIAQNRYRSFASATTFARALLGTKRTLTGSGPARSSKKEGPEPPLEKTPRPSREGKHRDAGTLGKYPGSFSGRRKRYKRHKALKQRLKQRQRSPAIETV